MFADHVDLQPQYGSAVAALSRAASLPCTPQLVACVKMHAAQLGLEVQQRGPAHYTLLVPRGDTRGRQLLSSGFPARWRGVIDGGTPAGQHALRLLARNKYLGHANLATTRRVSLRLISRCRLTRSGSIGSLPSRTIIAFSSAYSVVVRCPPQRAGSM